MGPISMLYTVQKGEQAMTLAAMSSMIQYGYIFAAIYLWITDAKPSAFVSGEIFDICKGNSSINAKS